MATEAKSNSSYSVAQVALIEAAIAANGGVGNLEMAKVLAADERMNDPEKGPRTYRGIIAKISRMGAAYENVGKVSKNGGEVAKKADLVKNIAELSGISAAKLNGLEKAPKLALETLKAAFASAA